jgi:hypothetical protein
VTKYLIHHYNYHLHNLMDSYNLSIPLLYIKMTKNLIHYYNHRLYNSLNNYNHSFKAWPGLVGRPGTRPTRGWNRAWLKKKQGKEKPGVTRLT